MRKSTNIELVEELEKVNITHKFDTIIKNAKNFRYHDYKAPEDVVCGKMEFVKDAAKFPELFYLSRRIQMGEFDEEADEADKAEMRKDLPSHMWETFGLNPLN